MIDQVEDLTQQKNVSNGNTSNNKVLLVVGIVATLIAFVTLSTQIFELMAIVHKTDDGLTSFGLLLELAVINFTILVVVGVLLLIQKGKGAALWIGLVGNLIGLGIFAASIVIGLIYSALVQ